MKLGNKIIQILTTLFVLISSVIADEKIVSTPLLNVEKIIPSFEEFVDENENVSTDQNLKEKESTALIRSSQAILIGLDKITAKSSKLVVNLNEKKKIWST